MSTLSRQFLSGIRDRYTALKATDDRGLQTIEWIGLVVLVLGLIAIVAVAVTAYVNAQIAQIPG
jgi:hypothetical protein